MADADAAAASAGRQRQAKARRGGRPKLRPPQREGWMDVYEELARVAYLETDEHEYRRKWVLLRDSWMYLYDNQEDVMLGRDAETMLAIDLRGSLCQRQPKLERTFVLESSALYTVHGHKHKMLFRTAAEEDVQPWVSDINESAIWDMVLRAAASSVSQKAAARGKPLRGTRGGDDASSVSARSAVSSASAGTRASSSSATSRGSGASLAASLSSSVSSLMGSKGRAAKRAPALDSGPRPRQRAGLPDLPEDELAGADSADGAHSTAVSGAAVAGAPAESRDSRPASDMHLKLAKLGGDSFPGSRRGASLGSSAILSAPKPLESAALPACAASEDEEADDDFGDAFVATDVLTPRSSRSNKSSSSVRCQQLPQAPEHLARKAEEGGSSRSSRFSPAPGGQDARALLQQSRQVLEHARHKRQPPPPPPPLREQRDTSSDVAAPKVSHTTEVPEEQDSARDAGAGRGGGAGGGAGVVARNHGGGRGLDVGPICPDANQVDSRMDSDSMDRDEGSIDPRASACGRSESGFSVLNDVMTQYTESEAPSDADNDDSSVDESDDGRVEQERQEFFREAFCLRGSDSEDDLTDLDQKLEARDAFESRRVRVRRVRRFYRRKVAVTAAPWTWGSGFHWCLGHGTHVDEKYPRMLRSLRNKGIIQMAAGGQHVAALSSSGQVFTWGVGMYGRLGHASMQDSTRPMLMDVTKKDCQAAQVACGHMHSAFVTTQGEVWCWGMGLYGELGLDDRYDHWLPQQVSELKGLYVTHVACGEHFTLACTGAGASYSWGRGKYGCLGLGDREDRLKPVQLRALSRVRVVRVIAGKSNPLALSDDGKLYSWGRGKFGAHGHGHSSHVLAPRKLPLPEDRIVVDMDCGRHHCAMLTIKGEVWCWGGGQGFALGNGKEEDSGVPIRVESIRKFVIIQVACGGNRTAAVARGGNLYMWGGGTTVSDPQRFSDLSGHYGKLHVNEEGGVLDPQPTRSYLTQLREEFAQGSGELFADAQADKFPRDLLKAALNEEISPAPLLRLRFELVQGAAEAVARFGLKEKLLQGLPLIHPEWAEGGLLGHDEQDNPAYREPAGMQCREEAASGQVGGLGSGSPGSKEIFRLQQALMLMESRHPDTQEAMAVETRVAREVLQLSMRLAPTLPLDDEVYPSSAHVPVLAQGHRSAAGRRGTADDDTDSVVSAGSWRSARSRGSQRSNAASTLSFAGGFDLSAALETTQHALFGAPTPSASAVAGKPAQSLPGAPLPRALVAQQQPAGPAHVPLTDDEAGRRGSSVDGINSHQGSAKRGSEEAGMGLEEDGNDSGEEGTADRDRWADAEPDLVWSDDDNDAASEAGSSRSHWSTSERKRGQLSEAAQVRQALSRPRLLRQLHEQVVAVVLGDGFSIALCNKNEASSGVIAAQEIRVSSKVRHEARVAQRSFEEKHGNIAATAAGAEEGSSVGSYAALSSASRIEKLSEGVKTVKRGRRIAGAQEKKRKEDGGSEDEGSNMDHVQVTAGRQSVGHSGQEPCTGASAAGSDGGDAGGGGKDAINECEIAVALVSTPRRPETADACAGQMEGHEDVVGESRAPKEKRKKSGSASRAKALKARTVDAQGQEPVREILQGWMLVHETVQQVRLPSYITRHLEEPAMKWDQRWMVLNNNELLIFQSPEEAQPLGKVVLDGYFASDYTAESHWGGHLGTPPRKKGPGECRIPTLELKPNFLFSSGPNNARHLYCRVKDSDELSKWLHALSEAAVLRMVRNTFTPLDIRPWDADVDWSVPDATAAWDAWRDIDEKESRRIAAEAGAVDSGPCAGESGELKQGALDVECGPGGRNADVVKAGGTEGAAAASAAGESAAGSGQGLAGMVAGLVAGVAGVAGITPREGSVTARSQATSDSGSASTKTVAAAGPAGSVTGNNVSENGIASQFARSNFLPALVGTHMEEMSRVLDETRKQLASLKEHHRVTLHQHALQAAQWSFEKKQVEEELDERTVQLAAATTEIATLRFECDDMRCQLRAKTAANGTQLVQHRSLASAPALSPCPAHPDAAAAPDATAVPKGGGLIESTAAELRAKTLGADATPRQDDVGGGARCTGMVASLLMAPEDPDDVGCAADRDRMCVEGSSSAQPQPAATRVDLKASGAHVSGAAERPRSRAEARLDTAAKTAAAAAATAVADRDRGGGRQQGLEVSSTLCSPAATRSAPAAPTCDPPPPPPPRARKLPPSTLTPAHAQGRGGAAKEGLDASSARLAVPPCPRGAPGRNARIGGCDSAEEEEEEEEGKVSSSDSEAVGGIEAVAV